jgi:two-component system response regulator HydG
LRVLQEREFNRVGGEKTIQVDVRVIAATNKNLTDLIGKGQFREDLYYRLNVVDMEIPPLRNRQQDIPLLAQHFLEMFAAKNHKEIKGFKPQALDLLIRHDWPGNVRELMNAVEKTVVLSRSAYLSEKDFPMYTGTALYDSAGSDISRIDIDGGNPLEAVERATILKVLEAVGGNKSEAARRLGITRKTLHKKLKSYGVMK